MHDTHPGGAERATRLAAPAPGSVMAGDSLAPALIAMTALAAVLRLWDLGDQILLGDELYTLWAIRANDLAELPGSVGAHDHSIPITMFYEILGRFTPIREWMLRVPIVVFGVALAPLGAMGARRFVGRDAALLFGFWLAVHPLFIYYGRFARPYGIDVVLLMAMAVVLDRARREPTRAAFAQAVALGALATWLHLLALLTAGLIFGGALLASILDTRSKDPERPAPEAARSAITGIIFAGLACLALVVVLYLPAAHGLTEHVFGQKLGATHIGFRTARALLPLLAGLHGEGAGIAFGLLGLVGLGVLARELGRRSLVLLVPAVLHPLLVIVLEPTKADYAPILARYMIYALPLWLLGICLLTTRLIRPWLTAEPTRARKSAIGRGDMFAACVALALLVAGPWSTIYASGSSFAHSNYFQQRNHLSGARSAFAWPPASVVELHPSSLHPVYGLVDPGTPLVVEWLPTSDAHYSPLARAQTFHRRPVRILPYRDFGESVDLALEVSEPAELASLPEGTLVIVHRGSASDPISRRFDALSTGLRDRFGEPVIDDAELIAYRVRAER